MNSFSPFSKQILKGNKVIAGLLSIYISAVAHEYIIAVSLRHINPILSILFAGFGGKYLDFIQCLLTRSAL